MSNFLLFMAIYQRSFICGKTGPYGTIRDDKREYVTSDFKEGHKEGVLFTVHEENKSPITVHEENKSPITVHEDNKHIYSTCCQFMKHVYDSTHNSHIYIYISHVTFEPKSYIINMNICKVSNIL